MASVCPGDEAFEVDAGRALSLMTEAVRARDSGHIDRPVWINGDEYLTCSYASAGAPRCLVGEVLFRAGVGIDQLETMGDSGILELYLADRLPITMTVGAVLVLRRAQIAHDQGHTWGEALDKAGDAAGKLIDLLRPQAFEQDAGAMHDQLQ